MRFDLPHELPDSVDWTQPIDWSHPLNQGLAFWGLSVPGAMGYGSATWRDLCSRHDGTLTSMDPKTDWGGAYSRSGGWGSLDFDGTNQFVTLGDPLGLKPGVRPFTVAAWIRCAATNSLRTFVRRDPGSGTRSIIILRQENTNVARWFLQNPSGTNRSVTGTRTITGGGWHRVVGTWDGGTARLYVNGRADGTAASGALGDMDGDTAPWTIGRYSLGEAFIGKMDDIRIAFRAWSEADVAMDFRTSQRHYDGLLNRISLPFYAPEEAGGGGGANRRRRIICGAAA